MVLSAMPERQNVDSKTLTTGLSINNNRIHVCKIALTVWLIIANERQGEDEMLHGGSLTTK